MSKLVPLCRAKDAINEHLGTNNVTTMQLDVAQFDNIRKFVDDFLAKDEPLHILINNAGVHIPGGWSDSPEKSGQRTPEGFEVLAERAMSCMHGRTRRVESVSAVCCFHSLTLCLVTAFLLMDCIGFCLVI